MLLKLENYLYKSKKKFCKALPVYGSLMSTALFSCTRTTKMIYVLGRTFKLNIQNEEAFATKRIPELIGSRLAFWNVEVPIRNIVHSLFYLELNTIVKVKGVARMTSHFKSIVIVFHKSDTHGNHLDVYVDGKEYIKPITAEDITESNISTVVTETFEDIHNESLTVNSHGHELDHSRQVIYSHYL